jgi:hypothetical protein
MPGNSRTRLVAGLALDLYFPAIILRAMHQLPRDRRRLDFSRLVSRHEHHAGIGGALHATSCTKVFGPRRKCICHDIFPRSEDIVIRRESLAPAEKIPSPIAHTCRKISVRALYRAENLVKRIEVDSVRKEDDYNQIFLRLDEIRAAKKTIQARFAVHQRMAGGQI